jgi:penicillin-insensitive murein endopeptidase
VANAWTINWVVEAISTRLRTREPRVPIDCGKERCIIDLPNEPGEADMNHPHHTAVIPTFVLLPQVCGNGYYSYSPSIRQYGTQETVDMIVQLAKDWQRNMHYEIGIGDMSYEHGGAMTPHHTHNKGLTVDVRPLRKDKRPAPVTISDAQYDRSSTSLLISSFLAHKNVKTILFNDHSISGVHSYAGHNNHFHVQTHR